MNGLVRKATLLTVCGLLGATAAMAGVPSASTSTIGANINLVGNKAGVVDVRGAKTIVIRDAGGNPVANSTVIIDFTLGYAAEFRIGSVQPFAGMGVSCGAHQVVVVTDATGSATFRVQGYAINPGGGITISGPPGPGLTNAAGATVTADGVTLGTLVVAAYDQNTLAGVNSIDQARLLNDIFSCNCAAPFGPNNRTRSDLNFDGRMTSVDLALFLQVSLPPGSSSQSNSVACP